MCAISVSEISERVTESMREAGYADCTIEGYRRAFRLLGRSCPDGMYDASAVEGFASAKRPDGLEYSDDRRRLRRRVATLCSSWAETGRVDLSRRPARSHPKPLAHGLSCALEEYRRSCASRGLSVGSVEAYLRVAREYAAFLEDGGTTDFSGADPSSVAGFMAHMARKWGNTSTASVASSLRPLLRHLGRGDLVEALALTRPHKDHKVIETLSDREAEAVAAACVSGAVRPRDAAITLLALTTGMRASDIVALRMRDVDWSHMSISTTQRKTGLPLSVPMCQALAEAMGRYILEERPESPHGEVFLRERAPYAPLSGHAAVHRVTGKALEAAGVDGAGTRLMRRGVASSMVAAGVPRPVVSAVLGHADPDSTDAYIATDEDGMRECVLPMPKGAVAR